MACREWNLYTEEPCRIVYGKRDKAIIDEEADDVIGRIVSGKRDEVKPFGEKEVNNYRKSLLP